MLKVVLDTNMYLSGLVYGGMVEIILDYITNDELKLYVSDDLKTETLKKFDEKKANPETIKKVKFLFDIKGIFITPTITLTVCRDPEDNFLLELAESANADYLITRDKDLLELPNKEWEKTKIVKPEEFLEIWRKRKVA